MKVWKKIYQANALPKQAGVAILKSNKVDFKLTLIKWDKQGHFILIKGEIHQYAPNVSAPNFIKHTLKEFEATYRL
jgi:hypothetical protein